MKDSSRIFLAGIPFFLVVAAVYGWWTAQESPTGQFEPIGTLALAVTGLLVAMIGGYFMLVDRRMKLDLPEDKPEGEIAEGAGLQGVYAPWSWWPLALAAAASICVLALAAGWWLLVIGVPVTVVALIGWVFEFSRHHHAH